MWNLPGPGIEPMSPALAGEFLATGPPGKPLNFFWFMSQVLSNAYQETDLSIFASNFLKYVLNASGCW